MDDLIQKLLDKKKEVAENLNKISDKIKETEVYLQASPAPANLFIEESEDGFEVFLSWELDKELNKKWRVYLIKKNETTLFKRAFIETKSEDRIKFIAYLSLLVDRVINELEKLNSQLNETLKRN